MLRKPSISKASPNIISNNVDVVFKLLTVSEISPSSSRPDVLLRSNKTICKLVGLAAPVSLLDSGASFFSFV